MIDVANLDLYDHTIGPWSFKVTDQELVLDPELLATLRHYLLRWLASNPHPESSWVQNKYGVPTLIVRFDCTISDGKLRIYEIEERPQGIGSGVILNPVFAERLEALRPAWPGFISVETPEHAARGSDDFLWIKQVPISQCPETGLVLVRSEPHEQEAWGLIGRSVSTIRTEGRKHYGVVMGLWHIVHKPDDLPWQSRYGFVLKPLQGSKCKDVCIWPGRKQSGSATRTKIERTLEREGTMHCQRFYAPPEFILNEQVYRLMLRPFFGFNPKERDPQKRWVYLGGEWLLGPSLRLHGGSDTIFGRLV